MYYPQNVVVKASAVSEALETARRMSSTQDLRMEFGCNNEDYLVLDGGNVLTLDGEETTHDLDYFHNEHFGYVGACTIKRLDADTWEVSAFYNGD
jgi:hypothetical protein